MAVTSVKPIRCTARLQRPAAPGLGRGGAWSFLILPKAASAKLPTRAMTTVEGTMNGSFFRVLATPDGAGSHWLKVTAKLRTASGAESGDMVALEIAPSEKELELTVPADVQRMLADAPGARAVWKDITTIARRDWVLWITSARRADTRARRIDTARDMLTAGQRRPCCFDRSGMYSKNLAPPHAAAD